MQKLHTNEERESIRDEPDLSIDAAQRSMVPMVSVKLNESGGHNAENRIYAHRF